MAEDTARPPLILASSSRARAALLRGADVPFEIVPARLDEDAIKDSLKAEGASPRHIAEALAEAKAVKISQRFPGALVLGADQVLAFEDRLFDKPRDAAQAQAHLRLLRGRTHQLITAQVAAENGRAIWRRIDQAKLSMRGFSDEFLDSYMRMAGEALTDCVGAYRLEGPGAQLFNRVDGDYFTILGLSLLPLLDYLRIRGVIET